MIVPMAGRGGAAPFSSINGPNHPLTPRAIWAISEKKKQRWWRIWSFQEY